MTDELNDKAIIISSEKSNVTNEHEGALVNDKDDLEEREDKHKSKKKKKVILNIFFLSILTNIFL